MANLLFKVFKIYLGHKFPVVFCILRHKLIQVSYLASIFSRFQHSTDSVHLSPPASLERDDSAQNAHGSSMPSISNPAYALVGDISQRATLKVLVEPNMLNLFFFFSCNADLQASVASSIRRSIRHRRRSTLLNRNNFRRRTQR
jgi:hypothetical protein